MFIYLYYIKQKHISLLLLFTGIFLLPKIQQASENSSLSARFRNLTSKDGLSHGRVNAIVQDQYGFMWFGTQNGLNRYDGNDFMIFKFESDNPHSLSGDGVTCLFRDENKDLIWVGTRNGLSTIHVKNLRINRIDLGPDRTIRTLYKAKGEKLWIGTHSGLILYNKQTGDFKVYNRQNSGLSHNIVRTIYRDQDSNLWVGTFDKLNKLARDTNRFQVIDMKRDYKPSIENHLILSILPHGKDSDSLLWIGSQKGLYLYDRYSETYKAYHRENNAQLSSEVIKTLHHGDNNNFWIGTDFGLTCFYPHEDSSEFYFHNIHDRFSLVNNVVWSIYEDSSGNLWFGTDNGISIMNKNANIFEYYPMSYELNGRHVGNQINDVVAGKRNLWLATLHGVICYNPAGGIKEIFNHASRASERLLLDKTNVLHIDKRERLWIGTAGGINIWDTQRERMYGFSADFESKTGLQSNYIRDFHETENEIFVATFQGGLHQSDQHLADSEHISFRKIKGLENIVMSSDENYLWLGSPRGLYRMDLLALNFSPVEKVNAQFKGDLIHSMLYTSNDKILLGLENGLLQYDIEKDTCSFHLIDPEANIRVINLVEDHSGNIWGSTVSKIFRYSMENGDFEFYYLEEAYSVKGFIRGSACKSPWGKIFFGGHDGLVGFHPDKIDINKCNTVAKITGLYVNNEQVLPSSIQEEGLIDELISFKDTIELEYDQRSIALQFSSLSYGNAPNNMFNYRLKGYNDSWKRTAGENNRVVYSQLSPGNYHFQLKGINNGKEDKEISDSLYIKVKPPLWASTGFIVLYIVGISGFIGLILYLQYIRVNWKNQMKMIEMERRHEEKLNRSRIQFFTNIAHELKTPLSLIYGPAHKLLSDKKMEPESQKHTKLIWKNAVRLRWLVSQMMNFRDIDTRNIQIQATQTELVSFVHGIYSQFSDKAERKLIQYDFHSEQEEKWLWIDQYKMETILFNLLSNAFKYTERKGNVSVSLSFIDEPIPGYREGYAVIRVEDTGIGIPEQEHDKIFDRFYQSADSVKMERGSGIGLTIVKEFVEMHHGEVTFDSTYGSGTEFRVTIPLGKQHFDESELSSKEQELVYTYYEMGSSGNEPEFKEYEAIYSDKALILIVEDDEEVIEFIRINLHHKYRFVTAADGKEAFKKAMEKKPDLIISDIRMPVMDGLSLCESLKENVKTMYIPVILLTAKTMNEGRIEGLKHGADAYLYKPFKMELLEARIKNLLRRTDQLVTSIKMDSLTKPSEVEMPSADEAFMKKLVSSIEKYISDPDLQVETLCDHLGMSHSSLYRRVKGLTGETINEFIKTIRVKRAAQLLRTQNFTVAEVMDEVGFSNHSYFSKCFRKIYNQSPGSYLKEAKENS